MKDIDKHACESVAIVDADLVGFFDLLARFDYEDRAKCPAGFESGLPAAPGRSASVPEIRSKYGAKKATK